MYVTSPTGATDVEYTDNRSWEEFTKSLINNRPRYIAAKLKSNNKIVFIAWIPTRAPQEMKNAYYSDFYEL